MQIHPPSANVVDGEFPVHLHPGGKFAVIEVDPGYTRTRLFMESVADCDRLIGAAALARLLLLGETSGPVRRALDPERDDWDGEELSSSQRAENAALYPDEQPGTDAS